MLNVRPACDRRVDPHIGVAVPSTRSLSRCATSLRAAGGNVVVDTSNAELRLHWTGVTGSRIFAVVTPVRRGGGTQLSDALPSPFLEILGKERLSSLSKGIGSIPS